MSNYTNRYNFWNTYKVKLKDIDAKFEFDFDYWENNYFKSEEQLKKLWKWMKNYGNYSGEFEEVIEKFACDKEWAKGLPACETYQQRLKRVITPQPDNTSTQTTIVKEPKKEKEVEAEITASDILNGSKKIGLKYKGDIVTDVQYKLSQLKDQYGQPFFSKQFGNNFGPETEAAVKRFQSENGLPPTGKVDQLTLKKLNYKNRPFKDIMEQVTKKLINESEITDINKQREYLTLAISNECIKLSDGKFVRTSDGRILAYRGQNDAGDVVVYYGNIDTEDGIIKYKIQGDTDVYELECSEVKSKINSEKERITNQENFITKLKQENPDLYETEVNPALIGKQYKKIDITTIEGALDYFNKGEKFIYQKIATYSTPTNKFAEQNTQLGTWGFSFTGTANEKLYGAPMTSYFGEKNQIISDFPEKNRIIYPLTSTLTSMEINYSACTQTINKLYGAIKREPGAIDKISPDDLPKEKLQVYRCAQNSSVTGKLRNLKVFGLRTPPLEKLNTILNDSTMYGVNPLLKSLRQNVQTESKDRVLKNIVRENLIKYKLQKKDNLIVEERKIVKQRFDIFKSNSKPSKQTQIKFFQEIIQESVILQKQGFDQKVISEGIFDIFSGLFGKQGGESVLQTFKEYIIGFIIKKLTPLDPDGWMGTAIKVSLADIDIADIPKLTNCNFLVERLAKSLPEVILAKFISEHTKDFGSLSKGALDVLRNSFSEGFSSLEFMNSIKTGLSSLICPGLSKISTKLDEKGDSLVQKAMGS